MAISHPQASVIIPETDPLSWSIADDQTGLTGDKTGSFDLTTTGTLGAGVSTFSGNNEDAIFVLLNLNNTDTPSTGEVDQSSDIVFNLTQRINSVASLHEAARISAYKVSDWFHATTEADTDSGLRFWTTDAGTAAVKWTIDNTGSLLSGTDGTGDYDIKTAGLIRTSSAEGMKTDLIQGYGANALDIGNVSYGAHVLHDLEVDGNVTIGSGSTLYVDYIEEAAGGNPQISVIAATLFDSTGATSYDWENREIKDSGGYLSANFNSRYLYDTAGNNPIIEWGNALLKDLSGVQSVDFSNRYMSDGNGAYKSIDWTNRQLFYSDGTTQIFEWASSGLMNDNSGTSSAEFFNRYLLTSGSVVSVNWGSRQLIASDGSTVAVDYSMSDGVQFNVGGANYVRLGSATEAGYFTGSGNVVYIADSTYALNVSTGTSYFNTTVGIGYATSPSAYLGVMDAAGTFAYLCDGGGSAGWFSNSGSSQQVYLVDGTWAVNATGNVTATGYLQSTDATAGQSIIASGLVVNEDSGGAAGDDFRAETTSNANAFVVDASADEVLLNVATKFSSTFRSSTANYRRYYHLPLAAFDPGLSGATWTPQAANNLNGYQLNAAGEILYFQADIHSDWDGASDLKVEINFQLLDAGSADDTVDLKLVCRYMSIGDTTTKTQTVEVATTTDGTQYKMYKATFTINYDEASNVVDAGDRISFALNLETDTSEIDNILIVDGSFYYNTTHVGIESGDS